MSNFLELEKDMDIIHKMYSGLLGKYQKKHKELLLKYNTLVKSHVEQIKVNNELAHSNASDSPVDTRGDLDEGLRLKNIHEKYHALLEKNEILEHQLQILRNAPIDAPALDSAEESDEEISLELKKIKGTYYYCSDKGALMGRELYTAIKQSDGEYDVGEPIGSYINNKVVLSRAPL